MDCIKPIITIACGAARAREVLGRLPEKILAEAGGNIISDVKFLRSAYIRSLGRIVWNHKNAPQRELKRPRGEPLHPQMRRSSVRI